MKPPDFIPLVGMGQISVARQQGILRTLVGSCVGLTLYDPRYQIAALAHIVLPESQGVMHFPGRFADTAIPEMILRMQQLAAGKRLQLSATLAGGANMFRLSGLGISIGEQNIQAVEKVLTSYRIAIVDRDVGGTQGRRMSLDVATGLVTIHLVGSPIRDLLES